MMRAITAKYLICRAFGLTPSRWRPARDELHERFNLQLIIKLRRGDPLPVLDGIDLNATSAEQEAV